MVKYLRFSDWGYMGLYIVLNACHTKFIYLFAQITDTLASHLKANTFLFV